MQLLKDKSYEKSIYHFERAVLPLNYSLDEVRIGDIFEFVGHIYHDH